MRRELRRRVGVDWFQGSRRKAGSTHPSVHRPFNSNPGSVAATVAVAVSPSAAIPAPSTLPPAHQAPHFLTPTPTPHMHTCARILNTSPRPAPTHPNPAAAPARSCPGSRRGARAQSQPALFQRFGWGVKGRFTALELEPLDCLHGTGVVAVGHCGCTGLGCCCA